MTASQDALTPPEDGTQGSEPLVLRFGGSLVEQLGAQMYPSVTATVAELISNAWDADAERVWVTLPFGDSWSEDSEIIVLDDGNGMTRALAQEAYLIVGRKRRQTDLGAKSEKGRFVHGRKGIGKLAAFGTAGVLDCSTLRGSEQTDFRLDYDKIRALDPSQDYAVEPLPDAPPLVDPEGNALLHGTRVRLTGLKMKRAISREQFVRSMSRRFSLNSVDMKVTITGPTGSVELEPFDIDTEFRFPADGVPEGATTDGAWAIESVDGKEVRWWFGFTEKPLTEDQQQGVSVIANGKMAQRPFKFERSQGTEGQLGQEYLVGEVRADWLDEGRDVENDLIQSNRDQLQLEDDRLTPFLDWGRKRLAWALRERARLRREKAIDSFETSEEVDKMLEPFTKTERRRFINVARAISKIGEIDSAGVAATMKSVVDARSDLAVRELMERIEEEDDPLQDKMWQLVSEFGLVDARRNLSIIEARLATIRSLKKAVEQGAREVPGIHNIVLADPWLLDPRWQLLDDEVDLTNVGIAYSPELDEEGKRIDFLFALAPKPPARRDEVVVVEIKRGSVTSGKVHKASETEVSKFHTYVLAVTNYFAKSTERPTVKGLMIAQDYTANANTLRRSLETIQDVRMQFRTWEAVIDDTERMHEGWLAVSRDRVGHAEKPTATPDPSAGA